MSPLFSLRQDTRSRSASRSLLPGEDRMRAGLAELLRGFKNPPEMAERLLSELAGDKAAN